MPGTQAAQSATLLFKDANLCLWGLTHRLGGVSRDLGQLKGENLICNSEEELAKQGYARNLGVADGETLVDLARPPFQALLAGAGRPQALLFHHSYPANVFPPGAASTEAGFMSHATYFPPALLREFEVDELPFLGLVASGCTGFFSLITAAGSFTAYGNSDPVLCMTSDVRPSGATYDALREKILTSDCASGFLVGRGARGYRVLGMSLYSTKRVSVQLVEIVKRSVRMAQDLAAALSIDMAKERMVYHFPNIFPAAWQMVASYLRPSKEALVLDGLGTRAHCLSSDPVITLGKEHRGEAGRLHLVVNFGSGLNLAVGLFREEADDGRLA
jgi:hypothetical protein